MKASFGLNLRDPSTALVFMRRGNQPQRSLIQEAKAFSSEAVQEEIWGKSR
jgi:hypothetical protein